jgi:hypothetical protein
MVLPRHPGQDEDVATTRSRSAKVIIVAVAALIIVMAVLHLTGAIHH